MRAPRRAREGDLDTADPYGPQRAAANRQMKPAKAKPLIAEWSQVFAVEVSAAEETELRERFPRREKTKQPLTLNGVTVPQGCYLLGPARGAGETGCGPESEGKSRKVVALGMPWKKEEFLRRAMQLSHPFDSIGGVSERARKAVELLLRHGPKETELYRRRTLLKWKLHAKRQEAEEAALHASLPEDVRAVLKGKKLLLLRDMLREAGHPDAGLVTDMITGFRIAGWLEPSGAFPMRAEPQHPEMATD